VKIDKKISIALIIVVLVIMNTFQYVVFPAGEHDGTPTQHRGDNVVNLPDWLVDRERVTTMGEVGRNRDIFSPVLGEVINTPKMPANQVPIEQPDENPSENDISRKPVERPRVIAIDTSSSLKSIYVHYQGVDVTLYEGDVIGPFVVKRISENEIVMENSQK
jgi:hypothetical protein